MANTVFPIPDPHSSLMKWELEKVLSLPIGDDIKEWILSSNLRRLIGLN
jgi:hypothetical protein